MNGLEQPDHRILDDDHFPGARRRRFDCHCAQSFCVAKACGLLFISPLLLPALAFGFAALVDINKL